MHIQFVAYNVIDKLKSYTFMEIKLITYIKNNLWKNFKIITIRIN